MPKNSYVLVLILFSILFSSSVHAQYDQLRTYQVICVSQEGFQQWQARGYTNNAARSVARGLVTFNTFGGRNWKPDGDAACARRYGENYGRFIGTTDLEFQDGPFDSVEEYITGSRQ